MALNVQSISKRLCYFTCDIYHVRSNRLKNTLTSLDSQSWIYLRTYLEVIPALTPAVANHKKVFPWILVADWLKSKVRMTPRSISAYIHYWRSNEVKRAIRFSFAVFCNYSRKLTSLASLVSLQRKSFFKPNQNNLTFQNADKNWKKL